MDAIGTTQPIALTLPPTVAAPALPTPTAIKTVHADTQSQPDFDAAAAEHKRLEMVKQAAQDIANVYVVSDKQFTIFKDASGQYITRFRDLRDGKVTYIPEPELFRLQRSEAPSLLRLKA